MLFDKTRYIPLTAPNLIAKDNIKKVTCEGSQPYASKRNKKTILKLRRIVLIIYLQKKG